MYLLDLPYEILSTIIEEISQQDAVQLAQTSHRAYDIAIQRVLARVVLGDGHAVPRKTGAQTLQGFASLIISDTERFAHHVRALEVHPNAFSSTSSPSEFRLVVSRRDYSTTPLLAGAIRHARNLRSIHIGDVEVLLRQEPSLADILAGYELLEHVQLTGIGPLTTALLGTMRSRPRKIELRTVGGHMSRVLEGLTTHADSLEDLSLKDCFLPPSFQLVGGVWHRVHTLSFGGYAPPLATLARHFPNVRNGRFHKFRQLAVDEYEDEGNVEWVSWPSLDTVEISGLIPLASPVRRIQLGAGLILNPLIAPGAVSALLSILQTTQPVVLSLIITRAPPGLFEGLASSVKSIRYLQMTHIDIPTSNDDENWAAVFTRDLEALRGLPLLALAVGGLRGYMRPMFGMDRAAEMARVLPTLRFVGSFADGVADDDVEGICERRWFRRCGVGSSDRESWRPQSQSCHHNPVVEEVPESEVAAVTAYLENLGRDGRGTTCI